MADAPFLAAGIAEQPGRRDEKQPPAAAPKSRVGRRSGAARHRPHLSCDRNSPATDWRCADNARRSGASSPRPQTDPRIRGSGPGSA